MKGGKHLISPLNIIYLDIKRLSPVVAQGTQSIPQIVSISVFSDVELVPLREVKS